MEVDIKQASASLSAITNAQTAAERYSQNNGVVHFVWVSVVMVSMVLCDVVRYLFGRIMSPYETAWAATIVGTILCASLGVADQLWRRRYMQQLPVQSSRIPSRWTYFRLSDGLHAGWNNVYVVVAWLGLMWLITSHNPAVIHFLLATSLYLATLFGLVVTLPSLIIGCRLWLRTHGRGQV